MRSDERAKWFEANRANWDERVPIHLKSYKSLQDLRSNRGRLSAIEESELKLTPGERVIHLQCHIGCDTLALLLGKQASFIAGVDFSPPAIHAARRLADEMAVGPDRVCFVESNVYDAPAAFPRQGEFDLAFVTWGAINWLPDIRGWAEVVSYYLKPGTGRLYLAEGHPAALVFDDLRRSEDSGLPGFLVPYFVREDDPLVLDSDRDYADPAARLTHTRTYEWIHPLARILEALQAAGLQLEFLHEHDAVPWRMFEILREDPDDGMFRWPAERWLPLSFSLQARKL